MLRPRVMGLMLALATLLVYLPVTRNGFINYDDPDYVTQNQVVQNGFTEAGIKWAFIGWHASNWHPLTWLSHMLDYELFRLDPAGHHLVNVLFHAANTALLFFLLFRLTGARWSAALVAALFALHPMHVESVAWVAERKDVLSTFFALLALLGYAGREKSRRDYWLAVLFFALGLLSKPMLVTLPCVMLLLDHWPLQRFRAGSFGKLVLEKWPFLLLSAASCLITFLAQRQEAVASLQKASLGLRLENVVTAYPNYLLKLIWPVNLAVFYPLPRQIPWECWLPALGILMAITAMAWRVRQSQPYWITGWLWFLGTLVPVIGLVQVGDQAMADRYSYFPSIGIFFALVFAIRDQVARIQSLKPVVVAAATLILCLCAGLTELQIRYWRDSETLFRHALAVTGDNALAHLNLGAALQAEAEAGSALAEYEKVVQLDPQRYEAWSDMAKLMYDLGRNEDALADCQQAIRINPQKASLHNSQGLVLLKLNRPDQALSEFATAAQLDANYTSPRFQMGQILLHDGQDLPALAQFHAALALDPNNYPMVIYVARVLASDENPQVRNGSEALTLASLANQLTAQPQSVGLDTLAMACAETGRFDEAVKIQEQAVHLAETGGLKNDVAPLQQRLQLYQDHQPWRESFARN